MQLVTSTQFREVSVPGFLFDLDLSNDGSLLACATRSDDHAGPVIRVICTKDGTISKHFMQTSAVNGRGVAFVSGGRDLVFLFQRSGDSTQLYRASLDSDTPAELQSYPAARNNCEIVRDCTGRLFAVLGNQVEIWDAETNKILQVLSGANPDQSIRAAFSRNGDHLYIYGTRESTVECYQVDTGKLTSSWEAPAPFGSQVVITPDERFLICAAESHRGLFVYDLVQGTRLEPRQDSALKFDRDSQWRPWTVSQDSRLLMCLKGRLRAVRLPDLEDVSPPEKIVAPSVRSWAATFAWEAPLVAFSTAEDEKLRCFDLVQSST